MQPTLGKPFISFFLFFLSSEQIFEGKKLAPKLWLESTKSKKRKLVDSNAANSAQDIQSKAN